MKNRPTQKSITVEMSDIVLPAYTNRYNALFGGKLMEIIDKAAAICSIRYCHENVVTASVEAVDFHTPIKANYIVQICAKTVYVGRSSMMVKVSVWSENPNTGGRTYCCTAYVNMVAVDENGKPKTVPALQIETEQDHTDWESAELIREATLARRARQREVQK